MPREAVSQSLPCTVSSLCFPINRDNSSREQLCQKKTMVCCSCCMCVWKELRLHGLFDPPPPPKKFPGAMSEALCVCALGSVRLFNGNVVLYANKGTTRPTVTKHATVLYLYLYCTCTTVLALALYCTVLYF